MTITKNIINYLIFIIALTCSIDAHSDENSAEQVQPVFTENEMSCNLKLQVEISPSSLNYDYQSSSSVSSGLDEQLFAYVGNKYTYDVGCSVSDPKMKPSDRYYVIDIVLYGPNLRVAKAYREQILGGQSLKSSKLLILNKKISFHFMGINTVVCSVTKYNNLVNKFTKLCQKTVKINATEKYEPLSQTNFRAPSVNPSPSNYIDLLFNKSRLDKAQASSLASSNQQLDALQKIITQQKNLWLNSEQNLANRSSIQVSTATTSQSSADDDSEEDDIESLSVIDAKAMKMRQDVNNLRKKSLNAALSSSSQNLEVNKLNSNQTKAYNLVQPLIIILIFLIIFSISIGTIAYITYHQKGDSTTSYSTNMKADHSVVVVSPSSSEREVTNNSCNTASSSSQVSTQSSFQQSFQKKIKFLDMKKIRIINFNNTSSSKKKSQISKMSISKNSQNSSLSSDKAEHQSLYSNSQVSSTIYSNNDCDFTLSNEKTLLNSNKNMTESTYSDNDENQISNLSELSRTKKRNNS
jgi:hypothetical protein